MDPIDAYKTPCLLINGEEPVTKPTSHPKEKPSTESVQTEIQTKRQKKQAEAQYQQFCKNASSGIERKSSIKGRNSSAQKQKIDDILGKDVIDGAFDEIMRSIFG